MPQPSGVLLANGVRSRALTPAGSAVSGVALPLVAKPAAARPLALMRVTLKNSIGLLRPPLGGVPTLPVAGSQLPPIWSENCEVPFGATEPPNGSGPPRILK